MDSDELTRKHNKVPFTSLVLVEISDEIGADDEISFVTTYKNNLYIGTNHGKLLHYYQFEDADNYMMLSRFEISPDQLPIRKLMVLPVLERLLVLCGTTASLYNLPELSPLHIGKLKDINDFLPLSYSSQAQTAQTSQTTPVDDKIVIFTPSKIAIVSVKRDQLKLSKEIHYVDSLVGVSTSSNMTSNFSNLVLVANKSTYDIIDMQLTRKIGLFEYDQSKSRHPVRPFIVPYNAVDQNGDEEYMLTIKTDETTSIVMFINFLGDVTRGTISFVDRGYPKNGVIASWPYVLGVFLVENRNKLVVSSLLTLETTGEIDLGEFLEETGQDPGLEAVEVSEDATRSEETAPVEESVPEQASLDVLKSELEQREAPDDTKIGSEQEAVLETAKDTETEDATEGDSKDMEQEEASKSPKSDFKQDTTVGAQGSSEQEDKLATPEPLVGEEHAGSVSKADAISSSSTAESFHLRSVSGVLYSDPYLEKLLAKISYKTQEVVPSGIDKSSANIVIHGGSKIWFVHTVNDIVKYLNEFNKALDLGDFQSLINDLKSTIDSFTGLFQSYLHQMLVLMLLYSKDFDTALTYLVRIKNGQLQFDPKIVLFLISDCDDDFYVFEGLQKIVSKERFTSPEHEKFLFLYCDNIYPDLVVNESKGAVRKLYYGRFKSSLEAIEFIEGADSTMWNDLLANKPTLCDLENKNLYFAQLHAYGKLLDFGSKDEELPELFCELGIKLLSGELEDQDFATRDQSKLVDQILFQLKEGNFNREAYAKILLEVLKIDHSKGFQFMIANKRHQHSDTHKKIMNEIPLDQANGLDFALLRLEYIESSFAEHQEPEKSRQLLGEVVKVLSSDAVLTETAVNNFTILLETYKLQNSLADSSWPKTTWIEFLHTAMKRTEAHILVQLYLKAYELLSFFHYQGLSQDVNQKLENISIFSYLGLVAAENPIAQLLDVCDYSSAEHFAVYRCLPFPMHRFYFASVPSANFVNGPSPKEGLIQVFQHYIDASQDDNVKLFAVQHFLHRYGDTVFSPVEALLMLPDNIPVLYVEEFLRRAVVDVGSTARTVSLRKVLGRADARSTAAIYRDLCDPAALSET
jgi:hypothetical protein